MSCLFSFSSRRRHTRSDRDWSSDVCSFFFFQAEDGIRDLIVTDRKSTRLNSSHDQISHGVFCLRSEEHTSGIQSRLHHVCSLLLLTIIVYLIKRSALKDRWSLRLSENSWL